MKTTVAFQFASCFKGSRTNAETLFLSLRQEIITGIDLQKELKGPDYILIGNDDVLLLCCGKSYIPKSISHKAEVLVKAFDLSSETAKRIIEEQCADLESKMLQKTDTGYQRVK